MSKISIKNGAASREIDAVMTAKLRDSLDGELALSFSVIGDDAAHINDNTTVEYAGQHYDVASFQRVMAGRQPTCQVVCEHASYRLNNPEYDKEYFTEIGVPAYVLGQILAGTGFTVGTVEYTEPITYSAQEAKSRRALLMELVALLGGELSFAGYAVSIVQHRGRTAPVELLGTDNVKDVGYSRDKRENVTAYNIALGRKTTLAAGDNIHIVFTPLGIDVQTRIIALDYNPYNPFEVTVEVGDHVNMLEDALYRIETQKVGKDTMMNGCRIGPEYGFEAVRNDKMARSYFRSDGFAMQTGDGSGGNWVDRLYYVTDTATGEVKLVLDGWFSANTIEALKANIDVVVTNVTITNVLAAEKAYIAELTVDQLDTSTMVQKYKAGDVSAVNYIRILENRIEFVTAEKTSDSPEAVKDRKGNTIYWSDDTYTEVTLQETAFPVLSYAYNGRVKLCIRFDGTGANAIPVMEWGEGSGVGNNEKAIIKKDEHGLHLWYWADAEHNGDVRAIDLRNDGVYITPWELTDLQFYNNGFTAVYSGQEFAWGWEKDGSGRITKLTNEHGEVVVGWNSGGMPT